MIFSPCEYTSDNNNNDDFKIIVHDTLMSGTKKFEMGIRINETEGITTQNIVLKKIFT